MTWTFASLPSRILEIGCIERECIFRRRLRSIEKYKNIDFKPCSLLFDGQLKVNPDWTAFQLRKTDVMQVGTEIIFPTDRRPTPLSPSPMDQLNKRTELKDKDNFTWQASMQIDRGKKRES